MLESVIEFVRQWQQLTGAIVGGVFSLGVALLVAYVHRAREDRAAGMVLISNLINLISRYQSLEKLSKARGVKEADHYKWLSEKLVQSRPKISSNFEASLSRLLLTDGRLAVHLELFRTLFHEMDEHLDRLSEDFKTHHDGSKPPRPIASIDADAKNAASAFAALSRHASCAEFLTDRFVMSHVPTWHRIRSAVSPTLRELQCRKVMREIAG